MNKIITILRFIFLMVIIFPGHAQLMRDSPSMTYVGAIEKKPGSLVQYRLDKVVANVTTLGFFPHKGGIVAYFYWCNSLNTCNGPDTVTIPEMNILARASLCPSGGVQDIQKLVECMHSQIPSGMYTAQVPVDYSTSGTRGRLCLRYLYNLTGPDNGMTFANTDNACQLSPNTLEWCSMVTP
ncbi:hypothetical protein UXP46_23885, partial [Enterobacter ludwigii]